MQKILFGIIMLVVVIGAIVYLTKDDSVVTDNTPQANTQTRPATTTNIPATDLGQDVPDESDVIAVAVHGENYKFSTSTIRVKQGQTVRVTFAIDSGLHDFTIDEIAGARTKQLQADQSETVEFVADKKGSFAYYCSVGNHRAMGMEGTLVVE